MTPGRHRHACTIMRTYAALSTAPKVLKKSAFNMASIFKVSRLKAVYEPIEKIQITKKMIHNHRYLRKVTVHFKNVNNCLNSNIYSYLETSGHQSFNLQLKCCSFSTPVLIRHLLQLKTVVFLHLGLICAILFTLFCITST